RLRNVFCCGATMRWLGCGTAGVEAAGGARTETETRESQQRYGQYGDRYRDAQDAAAHGASMLGAIFGQLNAQTWADATCTTIVAATDFTYMDPTSPTQLARVGHGGAFVQFPPGETGDCLCNPETDRPQSTWKIEDAKQFIKGKEEAITGGDYVWHLYLKTFRALWKVKERPQVRDQILETIRRLVRHVAPSVTMPANLPAGDVRPWINIDTADPDWAASTSPHLVFCFPDNCWRWITVNQRAIQTTPSYSQHVLDHELLHASDYWDAAQEYKKLHGDPPPDGGDHCRPVEKGASKSWADPWGKYVNNFIDFVEHREEPLQHEEIYASAVTPHFDRLTVEEKIDWFSGVLKNIPHDLPADKTFEAEQMVLRLFRNPVAEQLALRQGLARLLARTTLIFVLGDKDRKGIDLGRGRSLLNHFDLVWKLQLQVRATLLEAAKEE
ncbi:MAG: hypothetical protein ACRD2M_00935, partial [Terriglobales bacterium]